MELLIVTYHYIEPENKYKAGIYPISPGQFSSHLDILNETHSFISEEDLVHGISGEKNIPEKSCLVTFDDGLRSQYENAAPILKEKEIPAVFFISTQQYTEKKPAIVHQLHFLLSQIPSKELLSELEIAYKELSNQELDWSSIDRKKIIGWYIYDDEITATFKFLLNHLLLPSFAQKITKKIFNKFYKDGEDKFCKSLYLLPNQIDSLKSDPLFSIGLHSHTHMDISKFSKEEVVSDFRKNHEILTKNFGIKNIRGLSYPYGVTDKDGESNKIESVSRALSLFYGLTTEKGINTALSEPLLLKRFNPNDILHLKK